MLEPFDLNLRHLDGAVAVARMGAISAAATAVNLSQPALTQALAKLEQRLGHALFDRQPGGTRITVEGELFIVRATRAIEQLAESIRSVRRSMRLPALAYPERSVSMTQLRALSAVERAGSFAGAARDVGLSQPSVHRAARALELVMGTPLLVHVGQVIRPTLAGERLVIGIRLAFAELRAGLDELTALDRQGAGRIRIGTLPLPRAGLLPAALTRFAPAHTHAEVAIVEGPYAELLTALRGGDIDMLLGALRHPSPDGVTQQALFGDHLFVVGRAGHPLVGSAPTTAELARYPWVVGVEGAPMRRTWETLFVDAPAPVSRIACGSVLTTRGLLIGGDWLALMSLDQFRLEEGAGVLTRIGGSVPGSHRQIGVATRAGWVPTGTQSALMSALLDVGCERS